VIIRTPGGKWADELEAAGMVKAQAGRPGPYCLGRLIPRHWIEVKGVRLTRRDHATLPAPAKKRSKR